MAPNDSPLRTLLLLSALLASAAPLAAQQATVPADLFYATARILDTDRVAIGEAPASLATVLPETAEVVGTIYARRAGDGDEAGLVVARMAQAPDEASLAFESAVPAGWFRLDDPGGQGGGGFTSTGFADRDIVLCPSGRADARAVSVGFGPRPGGGALVMVSSGLVTRRRCDGEIRDEAPFGPHREPRVSRSDLPALSPPPGGQQTQRSGGGGSDTQEQGATLTWDGAARDAVDHYADALAKAGWTTLASGGTADAAAGTWMRSGDDGPRTVSISVVRLDRGFQFDLRLQLIAHGEND